MKGDKELKESEQIKFEVEDKTYRMILTSVTPADAALYTVKAHNTAGSVSCSGRVKIQREYRIYSPISRIFGSEKSYES